MKSLNQRTLTVVSVFALSTGSLMAQMPQRQMQPPPTQQEIAIMDAALKYNKDTNSTLYPTHDPELIKQGGVYYLFPTGGNISSSTDLINWKFAYNVGYSGNFVATKAAAFS